MFFNKVLLCSAAMLALATPPALAQSASGWGAGLEDGNGGVTLKGGFGVLGLEANEIVYEGAGSDEHVSKLIWQSASPVLTTSLDVSLPEGWTLGARLDVGMSGNGYMEDYDWFGPAFVSYDDDDWTHRSQHDDTSLDWYFNGTVQLGYNVIDEDGATVNVNGGLKYTDVQWTAYGGSYVYSDFEDGDPCGFRGCTGDFVDGEKGISYRQQLPALVAGVDANFEEGLWSYGLSAHGGLTFSAKDTDEHWQRDTTFVDTLVTAPLLQLGASAGYEVAEDVDFFVAGSVEKVFTARGDTVATGAEPGSYPDSAGADLIAGTLSVGFKGQF